MARDIVRRDFLKRVGAAGAVGAAGLSGCIGSPGGDGTGTSGGGGGPDGLVVIGYPEKGIQLFRDYYSQSDGEEEILVPDAPRDGAMPG